MKWDKKGIDKPVEKGNSTLDVRSLSIVKKFKHATLLENRRANMFGPVDYQTRRLIQVVLLDAERRKTEALTLIRLVSFI